MRRRKAFTLVEPLVVISILGVDLKVVIGSFGPNGVGQDIYGLDTIIKIMR